VCCCDLVDFDGVVFVVESIIYNMTMELTFENFYIANL